MVVLYSLSPCILDILEQVELPLCVVIAEQPNSAVCQTKSVGHVHTKALYQSLLGLPPRLYFDLVIFVELPDHYLQIRQHFTLLSVHGFSFDRFFIDAGQ